MLFSDELGELIEVASPNNNGLMGKNFFMQREVISSTNDFNNYTKAGIYDVSEASGALNGNGISHGVLVVFCLDEGRRIIHELFEVPGKKIHIRSRTGSGIWSEWSVVNY